MLNKKVIAIVCLIFVILLSYQSYYGSEKNKFQAKVAEIEKVKSIEKQNENTSDQKTQTNSLLSILTYPSNDELRITWEQEFSCESNTVCDFPFVNATSYEDALWLKRRGYPTKSMLALLDEISLADLEELAAKGNANAMKLLGINALKEKRDRGTILYGLQAVAQRPGSDTFARQLKAEGHLLANKPRLATIELKQAALLGDTNAQELYLELTFNSDPSYIDDINQMAYNTLVNLLQTSPNEWNLDPRPLPKGG